MALFQGGVNGRLDYDLLTALADAMPDWQFWFCGKMVDAPPAWTALRKRTNVRSFGMLAPEGIAELSKRSLVGLIPFKQEPVMRLSLPLKAYEYVACGLPVVSMPIDALAGKPNLFRIETTGEGFAAAIRALAPTRADPAAVAARMEEASLQSYDRRFAELKEALRNLPPPAPLPPAKGNVLMLYDDRSVRVRTVEEHLQAFKSYSRHTVFFMPATGYLPGLDSTDELLDLSPYDAVIVHYSVRVSTPDHLSLGVAESLKRYVGPKILFLQDEYDTTETARGWIETLGIDCVFTCVPKSSREAVYPTGRFPHVDFLPTLTGYVPEDTSLDRFAIPIEERKALIGYRGRKLPYQYGDLGYEKYRIGLDMRRLAEERGLPVDIEVDDRHRIYGDDWYRFLGSCRATLGTESGANIFDDHGELSGLAAQHAELSYEAFHARFLVEHEGKVRMNQVSPKIFEAIRLRTALVLFEGEYSGVVEPNLHYIPLKKDYSNADDVFAALLDLDRLKAMTERAYRDVIESGRYSYRAFVAGIDDYLDRRVGPSARSRLIVAPLFARHAQSEILDPLAGRGHAFLLTSSEIIGGRLSRETYVGGIEAIERSMRGESSLATAGIMAVSPTLKNIVWLVLRRLWLTLPDAARASFVAHLRKRARAWRTRSGASGSLARAGSRLVPNGLKNIARHFIR